MIIVALWISAFVQYQDIERPKPLIAMEQGRLALLSGQIEWKYCNLQNEPGRTYKFISRYALAGDRILEERGDQDGWVTFEGRERTPHSKFPQLFLSNAAGTWRYQETGASVSFWQSASPERESNPAPGWESFRDIRGLGALPMTQAVWQRGPGCIWLDLVNDGSGPPAESPAVTWKESRVGDQIEVTARLSDGSTIEWLVHPEKQWNAERIIVTSPDGKNRIRQVCKLERFGETWFPRTVEILANDKLVESFTIERASFNNPDDPTRFLPNDIGVEPGMNVKPQNFKVERPFVLFWDGDDTVDFETWKSALQTGRKRYGPTMLAKQAAVGEPVSEFLTPEQREDRARANREMPLSAQRDRTSSAWERYVRQAIVRYQFDDPQQQKAISILRECQREGHVYLDRKRDEFIDLQRSLLTARRDKTPAEFQRLNERLATLRKPIDVIFEEQLKPGIERIPTRAQRKAAEQATSQPATTRPK